MLGFIIKWDRYYYKVGLFFVLQIKANVITKEATFITKK